MDVHGLRFGRMAKAVIRLSLKMQADLKENQDSKAHQRHCSTGQKVSEDPSCYSAAENFYLEMHMDYLG
jgi:hypothetical protein